MGRLALKRGRYGRSKVLAFSILNGSSWVSSRQLCLCTGITYYSLVRALPRWTRFEYVERRLCRTWGRGDYEYRLRQHGRDWLGIAQRDLPAYRSFIGELVCWQQTMGVGKSDYTERMLALPFVEFRETLSRQIAEVFPGRRKIGAGGS